MLFPLLRRTALHTTLHPPRVLPSSHHALQAISTGSSSQLHPLTSQSITRWHATSRHHPFALKAISTGLHASTSQPHSLAPSVITRRHASTFEPPIVADHDPHLTKRELFSLLRLHKFDHDEINKAATLLSDSDDDTNDTKAIMVTEKSVSKYIDTLIAEGYDLNYSKDEISSRFMHSFRPGTSQTRAYQTSIPLKDITGTVESMATSIDFKAIMPISFSMLLVGSCVGMITPVMPMIVNNLNLNVTEFGYVISAFGAAKLLGNIPSAVLVEKHGRKPYLTYSLIAVAAGTSGIGFAGGLDQLILCRLMVGFGVAALSTSATLAVSDLSTPRNRASTMAPVMVGFSAGTALGPAFGGVMADAIGLESTFALIGTSFLGNSVLNYFMLEETKKTPLVVSHATAKGLEKQTIGEAFKVAVKMWKPLLSKPAVRNAVILNSCYWVALSGGQMTLLPLYLTDPDTFAMNASQLGQVYAGMSVVQVLGSQPLALVADRVGKQPVMIAGCGLVSTSILLLATQGSSGLESVYASLGLWALGSSFLATAPVAYVSDLVEDNERAQAIALLRTCGDMGFLGGAVCTGMLADLTTISSAMGACGTFLFMSTSWYFARSYMGKAKKR
jgi:MFS family permease